MDKEQNYLDPERMMRYAVFSIRNSLENGISYRRSFIVLKNGYGMIVRFTRLEDYAGIYAGRTYKPLQADPEPKLHFICGMLNYVIVENGKRLGVKHVFDITKPMLEEYFNSYGGNALMFIVTGVISMPTIKDMGARIAQDSYRQEQG